MKKLLLVLPLLLAACEAVPPEVVEVSCRTGPVLFPEEADAIRLACLQLKP